MILSRGELIPVLRGRPPVLRKNGQWHYISVHDQFYLRKLKQFRSELVVNHPDRASGNLMAFYRTKRLLEQFKTRERIFYWNLGLMPPDLDGRPLSPPATHKGPPKNRVNQGLDRATNQYHLGPEDHSRSCATSRGGTQCDCSWRRRQLHDRLRREKMDN